jgi:hypothetical protein
MGFAAGQALVSQNDCFLILDAVTIVFRQCSAIVAVVGQMTHRATAWAAALLWLESGQGCLDGLDKGGLQEMGIAFFLKK